MSKARRIEGAEAFAQELMKLCYGQGFNIATREDAFVPDSFCVWHRAEVIDFYDTLVLLVGGYMNHVESLWLSDSYNPEAEYIDLAKRVMDYMGTTKLFIEEGEGESTSKEWGTIRYVYNEVEYEDQMAAQKAWLDDLDKGERNGRVVPWLVCPECGRDVELRNFTNTCECGADYNFNGTRLAPRSQWGEETGENWQDCY